MTRDELITEALPLVQYQARRFVRLPRGISAEDLESAGNEALFHAATVWDPVGKEMGWKTYARKCIRNGMLKAIKAARTRRTVTLQPVIDGEELPPPLDPRQADPAEIAATRELLTGNRIADLQRALPSPAAVALRVTELRDAMMDAISTEDVSDVMKTVVKAAKGGDLKAARLLIDLLAPAKSGVTVKQQAIIVQRGDLD